MVVGLDPRWDRLPASLRENATTLADQAAALSQFCREVIDVVAPLVPAVKPNAAFFEEYGDAGMHALAEIIAAAKARDLLVVLDGKRNDIGSTAEAYARGLLGPDATARPLAGDALTVSPYLGSDSIEPFVDVAKSRDSGLFVLVKTSNPGGGMLQDLVADGRPIYRHVADYVEELASETAASCGYGAVGAVVGATYPEQLAELREAMPHSWFLVPGYGAQGGGASEVAAAFDAEGLGAIINSSRGIIFAYLSDTYRDKFGEAEWQQAVEAAAVEMITDLKAHTSVAQLSL